MENPIKMDDLGVPLFLETPIFPKFSQVRSCQISPFEVEDAFLGDSQLWVVVVKEVGKPRGPRTAAGHK